MKRAPLVALVIALLLALGGLVALLVSPAPTPDPPPLAETAPPGAPATTTAEAPAAPESAPAPTPRAWRQLFGTVRDPAGTPVASATVRLVVGRGGDRLTRTDAAGQYTLERVPAGARRLEFSARGYAPRRFERPTLPDAPRVRWDAELTPAAGIFGVVLVGDEPVMDARVTLSAGGTRGRPVEATSTDGGGRFALAADGRGPWLVTAVHGGHGTAAAEVSAPGEVTLRLPGGGFIEGRVVDPDGEPVEAFTVSATAIGRGGASPPTQSFESGAGEFRLGPVGAGLHVVWAVAEGYQPAEQRRVQVLPGETQQGVVLKLRRSATLSGRVTDARTGAPIEGATVVPAEWQAGELAESVGALTDADGRYALRSLPGLRTSIDVRAEGYRSLLVGGVEGKPGEKVVRDFSLSPQPRDEVPASELTGIGAVLGLHPRGVLVRSLVEGGPASTVLEEGDVVVMVDGKPVGRDMSKAAQAIRGEIGTEVALWVLRGGAGEPERVVLRRERVVLPDPHHPKTGHGEN